MNRRDFLKSAAATAAAAALPKDLSGSTTYMPYGCCVGNPAWIESQGDLENFTYYFKRFFSIVVPENFGKMDAMRPNQGTFDYAGLDSVRSFGTDNGINTFKFHTLLWNHTSVWPAWYSALSSSEKLTECENHVRTIVSRNRGKYQSIDVVNHPVTHGDYTNDHMGTGYSNVYVTRLALQWAYESDPDAILLVNDDAILHTQATRTRLITYANAVQSGGIPLHGLGLQAHFWTGIDLPNQTQLEANLDEVYNETGLPIYISEFTITPRAPDWDAIYQKRYFMDYFEVFNEHPAVQHVVMWGFQDEYSVPTDGGILDDTWTPRPVFWPFVNTYLLNEFKGRCTRRWWS